jgi:hypothetical protein
MINDFIDVFVLSSHGALEMELIIVIGCVSHLKLKIIDDL